MTLKERIFPQGKLAEFIKASFPCQETFETICNFLLTGKKLICLSTSFQ